MRIVVLYFHTLRDVAGCSTESVELPEGARVSDLLDALGAQYPRLAELRPSLLVAQDLEYVSASATLRDGEEIALMPPVSGG